MQYYIIKEILMPTGMLKTGTIIQPSMFSDKKLNRLVEKGVIGIAEDPKPITKNPPQDPKNEHNPNRAEWTFDAKQLEGKTLEMLNMMAAGHRAKHKLPTEQPFEDAAEARAYMMQDRK